MRASFGATPKTINFPPRLTAINAFSITAGTPVASMAQLNPSGSSANARLISLYVRVAPSCSASSRRCAFTSIITTRDAPPRTASCNSSNPIVPAPTMRKVSPDLGLRMCIPCTAQEIGSSSAASRHETVSGNI